MLRGASCEDNNAISFFGKLTQLMNVEQYDWYADDLELNYIYFCPGLYQGLELVEAMEEISSLSFIRLRRYPKGAAIDPIDDYQGFVRSQCDYLILYYDGGYLEMYGKDERLILKTLDLFRKENYQKIRCTTDSNDGRRCMHF